MLLPLLLVRIISPLDQGRSTTLLQCLLQHSHLHTLSYDRHCVFRNLPWIATRDDAAGTPTKPAIRSTEIRPVARETQNQSEEHASCLSMCDQLSVHCVPCVAVILPLPSIRRLTVRSASRSWRKPWALPRERAGLAAP